MYIGVDRDGALWKLLKGFLDAYNHRTDVMEASTDVAIQRRIDELAADMKTSTDKVEEAIQQDKGDG